MARWLVVGVGVALASIGACGYAPLTEFHCIDNAGCNASVGGVCEASGFCSYFDPSCADGGRRYGTASGELSNQCTASPIGNGSDSSDAFVPPLDALVCYGTGIVKLCFNNPPNTAIEINVAAVTVIDTDDPDSRFCSKAVISGGDGYCVVVATTIKLSTPVRASGSKPLVLVASTSITSVLDALLDVSSRRMRANGIPEVGAGADPSVAGACNAGNAPTNRGGGAGGSFTGSGGSGGGSGGVPGAANTPPYNTLRGGCPGQDGESNASSRGHGGGAVYLVAGTKIDLVGGINAGGEGGKGGDAANRGGGGAGAGGMVILDSPDITVFGPLVANGGGGGEGVSISSFAGLNGKDAEDAGVANGGKGGSQSGGDGGDGSAGAAAGAGAQGNSDGGGTAGGGGGGGGAGLIKIYGDSTPTLGDVSPAPTL